MTKLNVALVAATVCGFGATSILSANAQFEGPPYRIDAMSSPMHMTRIGDSKDNTKHRATAHKTKQYHRASSKTHANNKKSVNRQSSFPHNAGDYPADLSDYERTE